MMVIIAKMAGDCYDWVMKNIAIEKLDELLTRGVENVYPSKEALRSVLQSGKKLRIYTGIDPTGPTLHLGHAVTLRKLRQLQDLGHEIILLIGDFTAMIGDPTDKLATRQPLSHEEVLENCKNYKKQAGKILNFSDEKNPVKMKFNSQWLDKLDFKEIIELASCFTVQQMLERDMFQKRMEAQKPIGLHEFLYPLMQGYDSVKMDVDLEVGGNDQTFNMLAGRDLMRTMKQKEKFVLTAKLLTDSTGKKMGKTEGNMLTLEDAPEDMFGKVMSWTDGMIINGFEICTDVATEEIKKIKIGLEKNEINPRDAKLELAFEVVKALVGEKEAERSREYFVNTFSKREVPQDIPEIKITQKEIKLTELLVLSKLAASLSDARRKIEQGGVEMAGQKITDWKTIIGPEQSGAVVKVGKKDFLKPIFT